MTDPKEVDKTVRRPIKPLPARVINKIAAGEVVERPASVVKELVENAVDAAADRISIVIEKSGTKLIKVVDNGCGIDEEQVEIAFSRHATSKIAGFDDLDTLCSYGFRGEALPSIASVSRLRLVTRPRESQSGTEIIYEGGVLHSRKPVAASPGTIVEVETLFFNTPARRKFLKAGPTEARHISRTTTALAIGRYDLGFSLTMNGRELFAFLPGGSLKDRVAGLLGKDAEFLSLNGTIGPVTVEGSIGLPDLLQNNRFGQFIFINGRFIQSPVLSHAFAAGYGELIPKGMYPIGALLLTVDPSEVDVNVHPAKTEVRLSRERDIHDAVCRLVRETLRQDAVVPSLTARKPAASDVSPAHSVPDSVSSKRSQAPPSAHRPQSRDSTELLMELYRRTPPEPMASDRQVATVDLETGEILADAESPAPDIATQPADTPRLVGRFLDLYVLVQIGHDLYVVDQHTAHERVLFEEVLDAMEREGVHGQSLLFPVQVDLSPEQFSVVEEAAQTLRRSGFAVAPFGGRAVNIESVPSVLARKSPEMVFLRVVDDVLSLKKAGHDLNKAMAQSIACRSAVMAGDRLTDEEALHLVNRLLRCRDRYSCPHGRPTHIKISKTDLDKRFGRA